MVTAQILGYPLLLIATIELLLGQLLLSQNPRNTAVNKATAACVFAAALWSLSSGLMYIRLSLGLDYIFFARSSWVGWFTVPTAIQSVLYLGDDKSRKARIVGLILYPFWAAVLFLCLFTDLVVTDGYVALPYRNSPGPLEMPLRLSGGLLVFWLYAEIILLRRQVTGFRRTQLSYFLIGTVIFGTGGAVIGGFLQLFTGTGLEPSLSAYFSFPWAFMIFYAITRYRLFDIRLVVSRALYILALSLIISGLQFLLFKALAPLLGAMATIFLSVPIIGILFFGTPLSKGVQRWINEIVLGDRLTHHALLKESAAATVRILHLDELVHFITDSVRSGFRCEEVCVFLAGPGGQFMNSQCFRILHAPEGSRALPQSVVARLSADQSTVMREELVASLSAEDRRMGMLLGDLSIELLVPLVSKGRLLGALSLDARRDGASYLQSDIELLQILAGHTAIAIENAQLFEESVRIQASLREQEGMFRTLAETLPAAIFIHRGGKFLYVNPAATRMTGYSVDELLNMDFWRFAHPDAREMIIERGRARLQGGDPPSQYEFKIVRKDGAERWVLITVGKIGYGGKEAVIGTIFDISERKQAEESLREQEEQFRALAETMEAAVLIHSGGRFLYTNPAAVRLTGYSEQELLQTDYWSLVHPDFRDLLQARGKASISGEDPSRQYEFKVLRKDGAERWALTSIGRIVYQQQQAVIATLLDITDQKQVEEALRESEERFRQVSETAQEWIWEVDPSGLYTYSSPVVADILGYRVDEVIGKKYFYDFFDPEEREQLKREAFAVFERRETLKGFHNRKRHKDGREVILSTSGMPVVDPGRGFIGYRGVDVNITELIHAEQERVRLYEESVDHYQALLEAQQSHQAEKEKILKDLHDGVGGLTTNINLLAELARTYEDQDAIMRSLTTIAELSRESLSEIRGFIQSLDERELTWHAMAAELRHLGSTMIEPHSIRFVIATSLAGGSSPTSAIAMNLFRIYKESLSNIIKHAKASEVTVSFVQEERKVTLSVRDNGRGINGNPKTGRGIPNMKARADEIGGTYTVAHDGGTTIVVEVPIP